MMGQYDFLDTNPEADTKDDPEPIRPARPAAAIPKPTQAPADPLPQPPLVKTPGWSHQVDAYHYAMPQRGSLLALRMGEGKTWVAVNIAANMNARRILIISPLSAMGVWPREFARHSPVETKVVVLDKSTGNGEKKVLRMKHELSMAGVHNQPVALVINYESAIREDMAKFLTSQSWDLIVGDELHRAKAPNGKTGKLMGRLGSCAEKKLGLTGTPLPHSKLDAFSLYRFIDPSVFGYSFVKFRQQYAKMNPMFPSKVDRWINEEQFAQRFASRAFRVENTVLNLPPFTEQDLTFDLGAKGRKVYSELEDQLITEVDAGTVTASNALVKLLRLAQVASGFVRTVDDIDEQVDDGKEKLLLDLLEDLDQREPFVVFYRFQHDRDSIRKIAEQTGRRYGEISGQRKDLTPHSMMPENIDLMAVQIQSGGAGIDLTRACYCAYYSINFSMGDYLQSKARILRPGQTRSVRYYHFIANRTVDQIVYRVLSGREIMVEGVLSAIRSLRGAA